MVPNSFDFHLVHFIYNDSVVFSHNIQQCSIGDTSHFTIPILYNLAEGS